MRHEARISMSAVNMPAELPRRAAPKLSIPRLPAAVRWGLWGLCNAFALYLIVALYAQGQTVFALLGLVVAGIASFVFINRRAYAHRYIFPAVAGMLVFVIFPLLYTVGIGFTNYSGTNLLSFQQVQR